MTNPTHLDAVTLVEKIRDQLPIGSAQNYAAMLVLNQVNTYSDKYGIQIEVKERAAVTSLSLEFLYLAWCHDMGIELTESHALNWPAHVWKDSASLGINLHMLLKERHAQLLPDHDKLRDVRTLLSFGAVVNHYYKVLKAQEGGFESFKKSYYPVELEHYEFPGPRTLPDTYTIDTPNRAGDPGWGWPFAWGKNIEKLSKRKLPTFPLEPLAIPESKPSPPVGMLPLYVTESMVKFQLDTFKTSSSSTSTSSLTPSSMSSLDSATIPSSETDTSIANTQVSALERLEAYLSVLGTPQCEPIKLMPVRKPCLVSLEMAEKIARESKLQEPCQLPIRKPLASLANIHQEELPARVRDPARPLRWLTAQELKSQRSPSVVNSRLELVRGMCRLNKHQLKAVDKMSSLDPKSDLPKVLPLNIVKKSKIINID